MTSTSTKRSYVRLTPAQWAEIEAHWQSGEATLAQLSAQYGVTTRAIQLRVAKHGIVKGSEAKVVAAKIKAKVFAETLPGVEDTAERALDIRERTYRNALVIEGMILDRLEGAAADPTTTFAASAAIKMLSNAAQALERLHTLKRTALGITDDDAINAELPVLEIHDLTADEIADLQRNEDDDPGDLVADDADTDLVTLD